MTRPAKRAHGELDESGEESIPTPLIVLDLKDLKEDSKNATKLFKVWLKDTKATVKFTQNGNLLIFPTTDQERTTLLNRSLNYNSKTITELTPKGEELILKGMTYGEVKKLETELETNHGLSNVREMKSFTNKSITLKKVRMTCCDTVKAEKFLQEGIILNYQKFYFEEFKQKFRLTQCFKCQKLGHIAKNCKSENKVCIICSSIITEGDEDHEVDIADEGKITCKKQKKCALCGGEHSNAFSKCPKKIEKIKEINSKNGRSYASVTNPNSEPANSNVNNEFLTNLLTSFKDEVAEKIDQGIQSLREEINEMLNRMKKIETDIYDLKSSRDENVTKIKNLQSKVDSMKKSIEVNSQTTTRNAVLLIDFLYLIKPSFVNDETAVTNFSGFLSSCGLKMNNTEIKNRVKQIGKAK